MGGVQTRPLFQLSEVSVEVFVDAGDAGVVSQVGTAQVDGVCFAFYLREVVDNDGAVGCGASRKCRAGSARVDIYGTVRIWYD